MCGFMHLLQLVTRALSTPIIVYKIKQLPLRFSTVALIFVASEKFIC